MKVTVAYTEMVEKTIFDKVEIPEGIKEDKIKEYLLKNSQDLFGKELGKMNPKLVSKDVVYMRSE